MKRIINVRVTLLAALSFVAGIFAFYELLFGDFYFGLVVAALLVAAIIFGAVKRNRLWKFAVVALVFAVAGFGRCLLYCDTVNSRSVHGESVVLTGRVCDLGRNGEDNGSVYYLEDCTDGDVRYGGRIRVSLVSASLDVGDVVTVEGTLESVYPVRQEVDSYAVKHNIRYELNGAQITERWSGSLGTDEKIRKYIYDVTQQYMPGNGGTMYALLTGDRNAMDGEVQWAFGRAGIVHLLAVSGLHVGFISAILCFALRRLHLRPWAECILVTVPLLFYAYICAFAPSVMRAIAMLVCSYAARMLLSRYDMLSSLSCAALLTLLVCPMYLFDVGFQLSFLSVFGIAALYLPIDRYLKRKNTSKHWRRLIDSAVISLCCIFATLFALLAKGGDIALFGVIVNVIAIPVVSVAFALGLIGLLPLVHLLLFVADALLQAVVRISELIADVSFAAFRFKALYLTVIFAVVLMFALGGFINLGKKGKRFFYPICCFLIVASVVFAYIPKKSGNKAFVAQTAEDSVVAALDVNGNAAIVADFADYVPVRQALSYLDKYRVRRLDIYVARCSRTDTDALAAALDGFDVDTVYFLGTDANAEVTAMLARRNIDAVRQFPNSQTGAGVCVRTIHDGGLLAADIHIGTVGICVVYGGASQRLSLLDMGLGADIYLLSEADGAYSERGLYTFTPYQRDVDRNYGANKYGNFTIIQKRDKIYLSFR